MKNNLVVKILYKNRSRMKILSNYVNNVYLLRVNAETKMTAKAPTITPNRNSVLVTNCVALEMKFKIGGIAK